MFSNKELVNLPLLNKYYMTGKCIITKEDYQTQPFNKTDYHMWVGGELIQNCFPYLSLEDREFMISGISPKGWEQIFGE
jgi:hypothetical protein